MAVADLIGAVIGVLLLVIVAYLLIGSTLSTAEIVTNAQRATNLQEQTQLRTDFTIVKANIENESSFNCTINNTGKEIISDFRHMDIIVYGSGSNDYQLCTYDKDGGGAPGTWTIIPPDAGTDVIHPSELDPGESYRIEVTTSGISPYWFQITTGNGVYASKFL
jgi:archaeal flagellar protein FlaF